MSDTATMNDPPTRLYDGPKDLSPEVAWMLKQYIDTDPRTNKAIAAEIGIGNAFLYKLKSGSSRPSVPVAERIIEVLNLPPEAAEPLLAESSHGGGYTRTPLVPKTDHRLTSTVNVTVSAATWESFTQYLRVQDQPQAAKEIEARESYVYIARIRDGAVKIGHSINPYRRTATLYAELIAILPGGYAYEQELHRRFADHRLPNIGHEAFNPKGDLAEFIVEVTGTGLNRSDP